MDEVTPLTAGKRSATLDRTRAYLGITMSFLVRGKETGGRINLMEIQANQSKELPPHYHPWENEMYYVLEGTIDVFLEGVRGSVIVGPNELVFIPQNCAHVTRSQSDFVRMLAITQAIGDQPVTVDEYFDNMSELAETQEVATTQNSYVEVDPEELRQAAEMMAKHGAFLLSPEEIAQRLPDFPVFGANLR